MLAQQGGGGVAEIASRTQQVSQEAQQSPATLTRASGRKGKVLGMDKLEA